MANPPQLLPKPPIKLFVKAGVDGTSYGACPNSQRIYMILSLKSAIGGYNFTVYAVNLAKPIEEYKSLGLHLLPAISYLHDNFDNLDEILEYLDNNFPKCDLSYDNILAEKACKDVFSKFCFFIKSVSKDAYGLTVELEKLDKYLSGRKGKYICGDQLTYLDCELLPKLQQIRVAGRDLKGFEIPATLTGLWGYLQAAYASDVFRTTCPSDEEITLHWMERTELALTVPKPQRRKSALMNASQHQYSFDTPLDVKSEIPVVDLGVNKNLNPSNQPDVVVCVPTLPESASGQCKAAATASADQTLPDITDVGKVQDKLVQVYMDGSVLI